MGGNKDGKQNHLTKHSIANTRQNKNVLLIDTNPCQSDVLAAQAMSARVRRQQSKTCHSHDSIH
jgi:hypothetical protein